MSTSNACCAVCGKSFKRLQSHLAHNLACKSYYMLRVNAVATEAATIPNDGKMNTTKVSQGARSSLRESSAIVREVVDPLHNAKDLNAVEDDNFVMFDDNTLSDDDAGNQDASNKTEEEEGPDESVLDLCLELFKLRRANPLGLLRFSPEEKVQIELLDLLRKLHCPLKAFTVILKWAAKSNASGHVFREGFQPTREKVITKLYERYNMNGLIPKEKKLYLPHTQRTVSMIFFDAGEVFASLLSCPTLNQDKNYFFNEAKDPFVAPRASPDVGDIHTGRCYRKTYDALIKKAGVDMLLPCVMAMDKTHIDMAGRLQMEPITISHGLLNHVTRRLPSAMRILGYINHSTPANLPSDAEIDPRFNAPTDLPNDVGSRTQSKRLASKSLRDDSDRSLTQELAASPVPILASPRIPESSPECTPLLRDNSHGQKRHNAPMSWATPPLIAPMWKGLPHVLVRPHAGSRRNTR